MLKEAGFKRKLLLAAIAAPVAYGAYRTADVSKQWAEDARRPISYPIPSSLEDIQKQTQRIDSLADFSIWADKNIKNPLMRRTQKITAALAFNKGGELGVFKSDYANGTTALLITPDIKNEKQIAALLGREASYVKRGIRTNDDLWGKFPWRSRAQEAVLSAAIRPPEENPMFKDIDAGFEEAGIPADDPSRKKTLNLFRHALRTRRDLAIASTAFGAIQWNRSAN